MTPPSFSVLPGLDAVAVAGQRPATSPDTGFDAALAGTGFGPTKTGQGSRIATTADATSQLPFASARSGGAPIVLAQMAAASSPPAPRLIADTYGLATAMPAMSTLGAPSVAATPGPATGVSDTQGVAPVAGEAKTESTDTAVSPAVATPAPTTELARADLAPAAIGNRSSQTALPATTTEAEVKPSTPTANGTGDAISSSPAAKLAPGPASTTAIAMSKIASPSPKASPIAPATSVRGAVKDTPASEDETVADRTLPSTKQTSPAIATVLAPTAASSANPAMTPAPTAAVPAAATTMTGRPVTATRGGKAGVTQTEPDDTAAPSSAPNAENLGTAERSPAPDTAPPPPGVLVTPPANAVAQMATPHQAAANIRSDDDATPPSPGAGRTAPRSIAASPDAGTPTQATPGAEPTDSATPFAPLLKTDALPAGTPIVGQQADTASALQSAVTPVHAQAIPTAASAQPLATASTPTPATATVTVTPTPGQMGHDMGVAIARHVRTDGGEAMTVRLDPRDLGRIEVRMHFDDDGVLRAVVSADNPASLDLLRRDSADLNRALGDAGVRADQQSLRFDTRAGTGGGTGSGGNGTADGQPRQHQPASPYYSDDADADGGADIDPVWRPLNPRGRIDLMA
ncbi:flagellar hook-length control protein FliK [Sphingomonas sp. PP-F2F-G114-C0414]|uniref:flagellar hook-length control protein FliK n=1 Tax=Sphingomonas sp. PP-F2F-G114-C0414 TaxID=2135662 RepID=UPI000EF96B11|nr:flagellar hook-length control protein FliK [Sphingomonas sp. PP-F2F-G114-C0414]RMB26662.1 flagellar hook-length control protein FliK [Sphingomonas sp. PP-F2F-G114-C0414]